MPGLERLEHFHVGHLLNIAKDVIVVIRCAAIISLRGDHIRSVRGEYPPRIAATVLPMPPFAPVLQVACSMLLGHGRPHSIRVPGHEWPTEIEPLESCDCLDSGT